MKFAKTMFVICALALSTALVGCGGGNGASGQPAATSSFVKLQSDTGDYIGAGQSYTYTQASAQLSVNVSGGHLSVAVAGDQNWSGDFQVPNSLSQLQPGTYINLQRYPFHDPAKGGLNWSGNGRSSNALSGWFVIDSVTYANGTLTAIDLRFEQHSGGAIPALHGQIHWRLADNATATGPTTTLPAGLWQPAAGATPASGNYVYLQSETGDYIGAGKTYTYTQADSLIAVKVTDGHLSVTVAGDQNWSGNFQVMNSLSQLQPGYYGNLQRYLFHNPLVGGFEWSGEGRGSNTLTGWVVIDSVTYVNGALTALDLRFEQHSESAAPALHGKIHWTSTDTTAPAGPVNPPPAGLWQPAAGVTPATGSYIYLQSDPGDYIGAGQTYTYTLTNSLISFSVSGGHLAVTVNGDKTWSGDFQAMNSISQLQPGYYGGLQRYPFHNPLKGGLNWSGDGRGSNTLTGWFVIDAITVVNGALTAVDLRFEQHSDGAAPALHGKIHWTAADAAAPPSGPVNPPPAGLWRAPAGATPATGSYVYFQSDTNDYVGAGKTYTYTPANSQITAYSLVGDSSRGASLATNINGDTFWGGEVETMISLAQLQPGYYGGLQRVTAYNPVKGALDWGGDGRGCNTLTGWFAIDNVTYVSGIVTAVDLRFEQHCEGAAPAFRGQLHLLLGPPDGSGNSHAL